MEKNITLEKDYITYNISIKLISKLIVFHIETSEFPKKIYENSFSDSDMLSNHKSFCFYDDIESKFEYLKVAIKEPSKIIISKKDSLLELQIPSSVKNTPINDLSQFMTFKIEEKQKDFNDKISELYSLYKEIKIKINNNKEVNDLIEKNKEYEEKFEEMNNDINDLIEKNKEYEEKFEEMNNDINDLHQKNKGYEEKFEKMKNEINNLYQKNKEYEKKFENANNEINDLKEEIKNVKEQFKKDNKDLEDDYTNKINRFKNLNKTDHKNIENKIEKSEEKIKINTDKLNELENNCSSLQNQIFILTFNNLGNFKSPFEEYYNKLKANSDSVLFG